MSTSPNTKASHTVWQIVGTVLILGSVVAFLNTGTTYFPLIIFAGMCGVFIHKIVGKIREKEMERAAINREIEEIEENLRKKVEKQFKTAAEQGDMMAQYILAIFSLGGLSANQSSVDAKNWLKMLGENGSMKAQYALGEMYFCGLYGLGGLDDVLLNRVEALKWFRLAAKQESSDVKNDIELNCVNDEFAKHNHAEIVEMFELRIKKFEWLAETGATTAKSEFGFLYGDGLGVMHEDTIAVAYYRKLAEWGDVDAQYNLGVMYVKGQGIAQDYGEAVRWFILAAERGNALAQKDLETACEQLRLVAEQGNAIAQYYLGTAMYARDHDIPLNCGEAVKWFTLAAEQGKAIAQYSLGEMYRIGWGIKQNYAKAIKYLRMAAEQGGKKTQYNRDMMLAKDQSTEQGYAETVTSLESEEEESITTAQYILGVLYEFETDVGQDDAEAAKWYKMAAERGYKVAIDALQRINMKTAKRR